MIPNATILGPLSQSLTDWEQGFFRDVSPWGFIVFARNIGNPDQVKRLTGDLREAVGRDAPILIDQEGGRVQRMRSPHWREYLPALDQMERASDPIRAHWVRNRLIAAELYDIGIDANCAPMVDIAIQETHDFLKNRCYGSDLQSVVKVGQAVAGGLLDGGVLPILKHIPGHGRALSDSHLDLPTVDTNGEVLRQSDFAAFAALNDIPMGMTAHITYSAFDDRPATLSPKMMGLIRDEIGFDGLIMTDDISMEALSGSVAERSAASLAAGCDLVLHCNGEMADMEAVAEVCPVMLAKTEARAAAALAQRQSPAEIDIPAAIAELDRLISG